MLGDYQMSIDEKLDRILAILEEMVGRQKTGLEKIEEAKQPLIGSFATGYQKPDE